MRTSYRLVVGLVVLTATISACFSSPTRAAEKIRVACVGDSITFGAGVRQRRENNYPKVLGGLLGDGYEVRNFGVSGATLLKKGDRPYWKLGAFRAAKEFAPSIVVIKLGTNDSKPQNWKHAAEYHADLAAMVDEFAKLASKPKIYLCKPVPVVRDRWGINEKVVKGEVIPKIVAVASEKKTAIIDLYEALREHPALIPDGVHPNAAGAKILAKTVHAAITATPAGTKARVRPNFVVISADEMSWDDCGAYGHPKIRTPNLDRLARDGMRFDRVFLTISSCSPSRCSILTGRYPHATGAGELHLPLPEKQVTVFEILRASGYYTTAAGKWHLGGPRKKKVDKVYGRGGPSGCGQWVDAIRERPKDKPFFAWLAAFDPHRGYSKKAIENPHDPAHVRVPPYLPDVLETREDLALYYDEIARMDGFIGQVLAELESQGVAEETFVLFLSDNGRPFPRCKTTVFDSGVRTPFIVRFPRGVKAGTTTGSIVSSVDIAPTMLELAGLPKSETFQGRSFASILDDPKETTRKYAFSEHNWHDYTAHERSVRSTKFRYIWNAYPDLAGTPPADAVRSPTYKVMKKLRDAGKLPPEQRGCFVMPRPAEQLFDVEKDPHSLRNLANDPAHAEVLTELRAALAEWKKRTADAVPDSRRPDGFHRELGTPLRKR